MFYRSFFCLGMLFCSMVTAFGANLLQLTIKDAASKEALIGASVVELSGTQGAATNIDGKVDFRLEPGVYQMLVSYLGYQTDTFQISITNDSSTVFYLQENFNQLAEVEVVGNQQAKNNGVVGISKELLDKIPTFFGERELVRAIQLLPGVQSGSEGSTAIFVRGGSSDQNLVAMDGVPLFNLSHLFGILSVFNSDVINAADLYKNYIPSLLSNRLTSAITVSTKSPSYDETHLGFQVGVLNTKVLFETPIIKNKLSTQIAMRGCHAGVFIKPVSKSQYKVDNERGYISYYFYDINTSLNYKINQKNTLKWNFFFTDDRYIMSQEDENREGKNEEEQSYTYNRYADNKLSWKNILTSLHHNLELNKNLYFQQKLYSTQFILRQENIRIREFKSSTDQSIDQRTSLTHLASVHEMGYQAYVDWIKDVHVLRGGINIGMRNFVPDKSIYKLIINDELQEEESYNLNRFFAQDYAAFLDYSLKTKWLDVSTGLRFNYYNIKGYQRGSVLPRLSLEFKLPKSTVIQLASNINEQNVHMITGSIGDVMSDFWVPATKAVPVQRGFQNAISVRQNIKNWTWSVDAYHRIAQNQVEFVNRGTYSEKNSWENDVVSGGIGRAYGLELYLAKKFRGLYFSANYNLSKSERKFDTLNRGRWYPYAFDRRHDVSLMVNYTFNEKWEIVATWVYGTGRPYTMSDLIYPSLGLINYYDKKDETSPYLNNSSQQIQYFEERNNRRLRAFHHLDLGMNYKWKKGKWNQTINVSVYNIYNHKNVFAVMTRTSGNQETARTRYQSLTLLPLLPSFSYAIGF